MQWQNILSRYHSPKVVICLLKHCVKSVQMRSFSGTFFTVFQMNTGKYGPEKPPYLDTFHAVKLHYGSAKYRNFCRPMTSLGWQLRANQN